MWRDLKEVEIIEHPQNTTKNEGESETFNFAISYTETCPDDDQLLYMWKINEHVVNTTITTLRNVSFTRLLLPEDHTLTVTVCCKKAGLLDECESTPPAVTSNPATITLLQITIIEEPVAGTTLEGASVGWKVTLAYPGDCPGYVFEYFVNGKRNALFGTNRKTYTW